MYETFFGLRQRPFELTPNPRFLYLTPRHREALATIRYGLSAARGLTVLIGEAGTGKTTLLRAALSDAPTAHSRNVLLSNPTLTRAEFYELLTASFELPPAAATSKTKFLAEFQQDVQRRHALGGLSALILDEAQSLPYELMEEVRLLANVETATTKLLNVVLAGQPELADRLNEASLRQLKQRIGLRCQLTPLDLRETASYIAARIRTAGGDPAQLFTKQAIVTIYEASHGLPRTISVVCDNALLGAFAANLKTVDIDLVREVCRDLDLSTSSAGGAALVAPMRPVSPLRVDRDGAVAGVGAASDPPGRAPLVSSDRKPPSSFF